MSYIAKTKILRGKTVVEPGSVIADLAADEIPALLAIRAIEPVNAAQPVKSSNRSETQDTDTGDASEADTATASENGDQSAKADSKKAKGRK